METLSTWKSFGGVQGVYRHASSATGCAMTFAVYVPPLAPGQKAPVLWYLSGLTCTHANCMEKGEYRRAAAELGVIIVLPDTSPRGEGVPDEPENWQFGCGAGFYLDATEAPYARHFRMASYIMEDLPAVIAAHFPADMSRQGIFGHSMGGHGAITLALKNPGRFRSCSAFAPIVQPTTATLAVNAYQHYLGPDPQGWRAYDATCLIRDGHRLDELLVDQGTDDEFLSTLLRPELLREACAEAGIPLSLNLREGYGHSYYFVSSFMAEHIRWHAARL